MGPVVDSLCPPRTYFQDNYLSLTSCALLLRTSLWLCFLAECWVLGVRATPEVTTHGNGMQNIWNLDSDANASYDPR